MVYRPPLTEDQIAMLRADYAAGHTWNAIATKLGRTQPALVKIFRRYGISCQRRTRLSPEQITAIGERYANGERGSVLSREFKICQGHVGRIARTAGIALHGPTRGKVDDTAFSVLTPDSIYWIGMMITDGWVLDNGRLGIGLQVRDKIHVYEFKAFLNAENPVWFEDRETSFGGKGRFSMAVTSSQIAADLARYGVVPRKTHIASAVDELLYSRDFWRGCIDGDGSLFLHRSTYNGREYPGISFCGTETLVTQFSEYCCTITPHRRKVRPATYSKMSDFILVGRPALRVISALYADAPTALLRKRRLANDFIDRFAHDYNQS